MINRLIILAILVLTPGLSAQTVQGDILARLKSYKSDNSSVSISVDTLVENNFYRHMVYNQRNPGAMGYQIRIFSGSGTRAREDADKVRSQFLPRFEDINAYIVYDTPDYKVYVGDCRTKSEQIRLYNRVISSYPNAFPVYRRINVNYD